MHACQLAAEAAEALAHAHDRGVVHRDVKPANLMLTRNGRCKVVDFGLARVDDARDLTTLLGEYVGTPQFVAPEIVRGSPAMPRSDVYSLAATLWYLLTGRPPFGGNTALDAVREVLHAPLPDLRRLRPELSDRLIHTVGRALLRDPERRFESCDQFAKVLRVHTVPSVDQLPGTAADSASGSSGGLGELADLVAGTPPAGAGGSRTGGHRPAPGALRWLALLLPVVLTAAVLGGLLWWRQERMRNSALAPATAPADPGAGRGREAAPLPDRPPLQPHQTPASLPAAPDAAQAAHQPLPQPAPTVETDLMAKMAPDAKSNAFWKVEHWGGGSHVRRRSGKLVFFGTGERFGGGSAITRRVPEFDFFAAPITVTAAGISFRGEGTKGEQQVLRLALCSDQKTGYAARDAVNVSLHGDGHVSVGYKLGEPNKDSELVFKLLDTRVAGNITSATFRVDSRGYELDVVYRQGIGEEAVSHYAGPFTLKGPGLKREAWGAPPGRRTGGNGNSSLSVSGQQLQAQPTNTVTVEVGSLTATREAPQTP